MTSEEREQVLARLASGDVASLKDLNIKSNASLDEQAAIMRMIILFRLSPLEVENVYNKLVKHLQNSDLTINFKANEFFDGAAKDRLFNAFERNNTPDYMGQRDRAEEGLFDYSNTRGKSGTKGVLDRVKKFGRYGANTNPSFAPSMRPKYAALNFASYREGAAKSYGRSCMILKDHVKHNCSFTDKDSFGYIGNTSGASVVANYHHVSRLIVNMEERMLKALYNIATGNYLEAVRFGGYIEAQVHGNILFNRDVKRICIDNMEMQATPNPDRLKDTIVQFAKKNGIRLEYI